MSGNNLRAEGDKMKDIWVEKARKSYEGLRERVEEEFEAVHRIGIEKDSFCLKSAMMVVDNLIATALEEVARERDKELSEAWSFSSKNGGQARDLEKQLSEKEARIKELEAEVAELKDKIEHFEKREHIPGCYDVYGDCTCNDLHKNIVEELKQESLRHLKYLSDANKETEHQKSLKEAFENHSWELANRNNAEISSLSQKLELFENTLRCIAEPERQDRFTSQQLAKHALRMEPLNL